MNLAMVAHLWAHQKQDYASNSGGNFYFQNESIYSYGSYFRCASIVRNRQGETAYLVTDRTYSNTTANHMNHVRNAIPFSRTVFTTGRKVELRKGKLTEQSYMQAIYYIIDRVKHIDELAFKQKRARKCDYIGNIQDEIRNIVRWIEFWGLGKRQKSDRGLWLFPAISKMLSHWWANGAKYWHSYEYNRYQERHYTDRLQLKDLLQLIVDMKLLGPSDTIPSRDALCELCARWTNDADVAARSVVLSRLMNTAQKKRDKAELKAFKEKVAKWRKGEIHRLVVPGCYRSNAVLRVRDSKVETSLGITIEAVEAKRVWKIMRCYHNRKAEFRHDVIRDASDHPWTINSFENDVMKAGCHKLHFYDMAYAAQQLGMAV